MISKNKKFDRSLQTIADNYKNQLKISKKRENIKQFERQ